MSEINSGRGGRMAEAAAVEVIEARDRILHALDPRQPKKLTLHQAAREIGLSGSKVKRIVYGEVERLWAIERDAIREWSERRLARQNGDRQALLRRIEASEELARRALEEAGALREILARGQAGAARPMADPQRLQAGASGAAADRALTHRTLQRGRT